MTGFDADPATDSTESDRAPPGESPGNSRSDSAADAGPPAPHGAQSRGGIDPNRPDETVLLVRDVVTSVAAVFLVGVYLFAISGVWPPMVAIESGSMEPNMEVNDLVFVMDTQRFQPDVAHAGTGVVTAERGAETGYRQFNGYGDVIVFQPYGNSDRTPIIHRAMFWVEAGENWCEQADPNYLRGLDQGESNCIADHDGFITKGDGNLVYDQT
jgi:signal peptidase